MSCPLSWSSALGSARPLGRARNEASPQQAAGYQTEGHCRGDTTVTPHSSLCKVTSQQAPRNLLIQLQVIDLKLYRLAVNAVPWDKNKEKYKLHSPKGELNFLHHAIIEGDTWAP